MKPKDGPLPEWSGRAVLHVDLDAFFASVEQLDDPALRGKPVIVGGSPGKRGVVSTCSYEARVFGVRSAMPSARAAQLCPQAIWVRGNFERYRELSRQVRAIFESETPAVQPLSIDEAFLDVTQGRYSDEHPVEVAERIRSRIAELGITGSVGVAASKTVAKIASDFDKPDGITIVWPGREREFLAPLEVRALSGIGPKSAERLERLGIRTLGDLAALDEETASTALGRYGASLVRRAQGIDERSVHENDPVKSVSNERTFACDLREAAEIDAALEQLATHVGRRLRKKGIAGRTVTVKLRFNDFTTRTIQRTLAVPTDDELLFGAIARELVREAWTPGIGVRLLGVGLSGFGDKTAQMGLFAEDEADVGASAVTQPERREAIVKGLDAVRERFGDDAVRFGRELAVPRRRPIVPDREDGEVK
ncbi:MAG: DNA polymerase IV [Coriobacteriales bacterium]|nr:DNA polymerase IV [Coriobacteriales bacterium]